MKKVKVKSEAQYGGKVKYNLKPPCMKAKVLETAYSVVQK